MTTPLTLVVAGPFILPVAGEGSMVDTWASIGSCAQVGRNVEARVSHSYQRLAKDGAEVFTDAGVEHGACDTVDLTEQ